MADFNSWALQYVLSDEEGRKMDAVAQTTAAIKAATARSIAVLSWIQSIDPWIPRATTGSRPVREHDDGVDEVDDGEAEVSIIARAKALEYLADTLALMDRDLLRADQVNLLVAFFGRLFSLDHKAGITAAAKALHQLAAMKAFKPEMGDTVIQSVAAMRDDFRLQPPDTRLLIYGLLKRLLGDTHVSSQLQHVYGSSGGFALDLLHLCSHERDPNCLIAWFEILRGLATDFSLSEDVQGEIFKNFSAYFPISMRSTVSPAGVTVEDLKLALRSCFAAADGLARFALPFLVEKLDQGDAVATSIKVDILRTMRHCLEQYRHPSLSMVPFTHRIWASLKYEVRNGEVEESIEGTLDVIRTMSLRLSTSAATGSEGDPLTRFATAVLDDCLDDLANPTYAKQAGLLLESVLAVHVRPFVVMVPRVIGTLSENVREPRTLDHARAYLTFMAKLLEARSRLVEASAPERGTPPTSEQDGLVELDIRIQEQFYSTYIRFWKENNIETPHADNVAILKEVASGFASLVCLPRRVFPLSRPEQCGMICALLSDRIVNIFQLSSAPDTELRKDLADAAIRALQRIVLVYPDGYYSMLDRAVATLKDRNWGCRPSRNSLVMLKTLLSRLAYIGCSDIPNAGHPLQHLYLFTGSLLRFLFTLMDRRAPIEVATITLSSIYAAMLHFRDACVSRDLLRCRTAVAGDWEACTARFQRSYPDFLPMGQVPALQGEPATGEGPTIYPESTDIFRDCLECALFIVVQLYRRATAATLDSPPRLGLGTDFSPGLAVGARSGGSGAVANEDDGAPTTADLQDAYLHRLAELGTFVVREFTEEEQQSLKVSAEVSLLFRLARVPDSWLCAEDDGRTNVLSFGILQGLWPAVMTSMYTSDGVSRYVLADLATTDSLPERTQKVRDRIATVVANKWIPKSSTDELRSKLWSTTVEAVSRLLGAGLSPSSPTRLPSADHVLLAAEPGSGAPDLGIERFTRVLALVAGAVARRDKDVDGLVAQLFSITVSSRTHGEAMARRLEDLVSTKDQLSAENHPVIKNLHQQWVYTRFVRPRLKMAFPFVQDDPERLVLTISILHLIKHFAFQIYEEDIESVIRLVLAAISSLQNLSDVEAALKALQKTLASKPDALRGQLKAVIAATTKAVRLGLDTPSSPGATPRQAKGARENSAGRFDKQGNAASCRRGALKILKCLAEVFDEQALAPHSAQLSRVLMTSCGDPVREARQCALLARRAWAEVGK